MERDFSDVGKGYSREERESYISWDDSSDTVEIYTASPVWARRFQKVADSYGIVGQKTEKGDGVMWRFPKNVISLRKKRKYTEKQLRDLRERGKKLAEIRAAERGMEDDVPF